MSDLLPKTKYMKAVWTFNGIALAILLLIGLISELPIRYFIQMFEEEPVERGIIVGSKAERASDRNINLQHLVYQRPTKIKNSDYFYSPIVVMDKDLPDDIIDDIESASDYSVYIIGAAINILFFDENGTMVRKLLPENGYIEEYLIGYERYNYFSSDEITMPFALYQIAMSDDNGDSRINDEDSTPFYISKLDGTDLRKITPDSLQLHKGWFSEDFNTIFFEEVLIDTDSPLAYKGYFEKTRVIYRYDIKEDIFKRFDALQEEFEKIQNSFDNTID